MIQIRKWLDSLSDVELLKLWVNQIINNVGCNACPVGRETCKKMIADCDKTFLDWASQEVEEVEIDTGKLQRENADLKTFIKKQIENSENFIKSY